MTNGKNDEMDNNEDGKASEGNYKGKLDSDAVPNQHTLKGDCSTCVQIVAGSYRVIVPTIRSVKLQQSAMLPVPNQTPAMVQTKRLDYHSATRTRILMRRHSFLNSISDNKNNNTSS